MNKSALHFAQLSTEATALERKNLDIAYRAALEGIVLLENDGALPLVPGPVALFGVGADLTVKGGTGSGEVNSRHAVSIREGLEGAGFTVTSSAWIDAYAKVYEAGELAYGREFRRRLLRLDIANLMNSPYSHPAGAPVTLADLEMSGTDTCLYVVTRQAGEGADRRLESADNQLFAQERADIELCAAHFSKFVLIINTGSTFDLSFLDEIPGINAVIFFAQQGDMGGAALADLLCGAATPSGKLASTWVRHYDDVPFAREYSYLNGDVDEEYYKEGIFVGYRYYDTFDVAPRYPFGFGRSYTEFAIAAGVPRAAGSVPMASDAAKASVIEVPVTVTNTGKCFAGREVVQLYVSCPQTPELPKADQQLAAFGKTGLLAPGASETLTLRLDMRDLASYRERDAVTVLEAGDYVLRVGNSSRDTNVCGVVTLTGEAILARHEHFCAPIAAIKEITVPADCVNKHAVLAAAAKTSGVPCLSLLAADFRSGTDTSGAAHRPSAPVQKNKPAAPAASCAGWPPELADLLDTLTTDELIELCVGDGLPVLKQSTKRFFEAPGAVGLTTPHLQHRGIPNICLADGPAGLRLLRTSAVTKKGKIKQIDPAMELMKYLPGFVKKFMFGDPARDQLVYQYTTAFPVELALAQTWNPALLETIGRAVSAEMTAYGITCWLAPAINIHRNPLCGRNFEYYSEDPFLTGKLAAAVTRGVQSEPGNVVTLKHFACNNQEDNRNRTNANVSERALREIYLRGFEIAVREAHPGAVMTSYNKLNGTYTPNSRDLLTGILRGEWGFDGVVMTDWLATGKGLASEPAALAAGNDLIMPGSGSAKKAIRSALRTGTLSHDALRRSAANVLQVVRRSRVWELFQQNLR